MVFSFSNFTPKMYTGLQVARDPGSPMIWIGSILLILGLTVMMYMPELRLWVRFMPAGEDAKLQLCGKSAGRSEMGVELLLERLGAGLKTGTLPA
jgi:cytochrome c biogenesis protein